MHSPTSAMLSTVRLNRTGNVGAGEQVLSRIWVPPNVLRNVGDSIFIHAAVVLAANANNKTSKLNFGPASIAGRGPAADNNSVHDIRARIYLRETNLWSVGLTANLSTSSQIIAQGDITFVQANPKAPIEITLLGMGTANDDVVSRVLRYSYIPAFSNFEQ